MRHIMIMNTPIGKLKVVEEEKYIIEVSMFCKSDVEHMNEAEELVKIKKTVQDEDGSTLLLMAKEQLEEYFAGERKVFALPLKPKGTSFQTRVRESLLKIPYGETRTYKEIAMQVGKEKAFRAVGMANNRNPIMILIPCHRVIGTNGKMIGYGAGIPIKEYLLNLEQG